MTKQAYYCAKATTEKDLESICRVRHEAYRASDAAEGVGAGPLVTDAFDGRPNCPSFGLRVKDQAELLGAIRPCHYLPSRPEVAIPAFELFRAELERGCGLDVPIVQSTHFVVSSSIRGIDLAPKFALFREVLRMADEHGAAYVVTQIRNRTGHLDFFGHMGFEPMSEPKWVAHYNNEVVLIGVRSEVLVERLRNRKVYAPILDLPLKHFG